MQLLVHEFIIIEGRCIYVFEVCNSASKHSLQAFDAVNLRLFGHQDLLPETQLVLSVKIAGSDYDEELNSREDEQEVISEKTPRVLSILLVALQDSM